MTVEQTPTESVGRVAAGPSSRGSHAGPRFGARGDVLAAALFAAALVVLGVMTTRFFSVDNARAILAATSTVGITAMGATLIMVCGSTVSLAVSQTASAAAMVFLSSVHWGLLAAIVVTLLVTVVMTTAQGAAVGYWGANPIVLTIAAGFAIDGASTWLSGGSNVYPSSTAFQRLNATPWGVPLSVYVLVVITALTYLLLARTTYGAQMYLVGENRAAARAAGLPVGRVIVTAWASFGLCIGLTAIFLGAFNTSANTATGGNLSLDAVAAVLVGGTAIAGGRGSALRTLGGALLIAAIADLLLLRGYSSGVQTLVEGALVLLVVLVVHLRHRRKGHR